MRTPNYIYTIDNGVIFVEDPGGNHMSVTNAVEIVLEEISKELIQDGISGSGIQDFKVIYKDSEGVIDGIEIDSKGRFVNFYHIGETNFYSAKLKVK